MRSRGHSLSTPMCPFPGAAIAKTTNRQKLTHRSGGWKPKVKVSLLGERPAISTFWGCTPVTSFQLDHLCKDPVSKCSHILRPRGLVTPCYTCGRFFVTAV